MISKGKKELQSLQWEPERKDLLQSLVKEEEGLLLYSVKQP